MIEKIVSGGQTGVDRGALDAAIDSGFPCGGWCPAGRKSEDGRIPDRYPLAEIRDDNYRCRTRLNVQDADGTLIFYRDRLSGGTEATLEYCLRERKPYKLIDAGEIPAERAAILVAAFVEQAGIKKLNVAGPRESGWQGARSYTAEVIGRFLRTVCD